jgi:uncharacterized membrane protein
MKIEFKFKQMYRVFLAFMSISTWELFIMLLLRVNEYEWVLSGWVSGWMHGWVIEWNLTSWYYFLCSISFFIVHNGDYAHVMWQTKRNNKSGLNVKTCTTKLAIVLTFVPLKLHLLQKL